MKHDQHYLDEFVTSVPSILRLSEAERRDWAYSSSNPQDDAYVPGVDYEIGRDC